MTRTRPATTAPPILSARLPALALIAAVLALAFASPALAQDPTATQYNTPVVQVHEPAGQTPPAASGLQSSVVGGLPFTGLDLIALAAVAAAFTAVGFALRRMTAGKHGGPAA